MLRIYLDNNATTKVDPLVAEAMVKELTAPPSNPSSLHFFGQQAKNRLMKAREKVASYCRCKTHEILFMSSGTEAMNFLIRGLAPLSCHILSSNTEHSCIENTLLDLQKQGRKITFLPSGTTGILDPLAIENAIEENTGLLVFSAVNSETGVRLDLEAVAKIANKHNIPLVIDGVALLGKEPLVIPKGVTGMGFSAHKCHGPKGSAFVFLKAKSKISPLIAGGGQEYGLRSSTENLPGIIGLAQMLETIDIKSFERMNHLRDSFEKQILQALPFAKINGEKNRVCNVSNLAFPGIGAETLLIQLDLLGIAASQGSACSSGAMEPSRILMQMGLPSAIVKSSLRFTLSKFTTQEEIDKTALVLIQLVSKLK